MTQLGMDVDTVESIAHQMVAKAHSVTSVVATAGRLIHSSQQLWFGGNAARFFQVWVAQEQAVRRLAHDLEATGNKLLDQAAQQRGASRGEGMGIGTGIGSAGIGTSAPPPPSGGVTPAMSAQWWAKLTPGEQAWVIANHPEWVGNRNGIPFEVRDQANRAMLPGKISELQGDVKRLEEERQRLRDSLPWSDTKNWLEKYEDSLFLGDDAVAAYQIHELDGRIIDAQHRLDAARNIQKNIGPASGDGHFSLISMDFSGRNATAAVGVGDVDRADHVGVFTPGISTTVEGSLAGYVTDVGHLKSEAEADLRRSGRGNEQVAMVAWLGYEAPDNPLENQRDLFDGSRNTFTSESAQRGGSALADFYRGIDAARETDAHVVALGHSYGSLTTAYALREQGVAVDDVAFFGSPGLATNKVGTLSVPAGHAYLLEAKDDAVADLGGFGGDASDAAGLTHLYTGATSGPTGSLIQSTGHSEYLAPSTTSQYNMAQVLVGDYPDVIRGDEGVDLGDALRSGVPPTLDLYLEYRE